MIVAVIVWFHFQMYWYKQEHGVIVIVIIIITIMSRGEVSAESLQMKNTVPLNMLFLKVLYQGSH